MHIRASMPVNAGVAQQVRHQVHTAPGRSHDRNCRSLLIIMPPHGYQCPQSHRSGRLCPILLQAHRMRVVRVRVPRGMAHPGSIAAVRAALRPTAAAAMQPEEVALSPAAASPAAPHLEDTPVAAPHNSRGLKAGAGRLAGAAALVGLACCVALATGGGPAHAAINPQALAAAAETTVNAGDTAWVLTSTALVRPKPHSMLGPQARALRRGGQGSQGRLQRTEGAV